MNSVPTAKSFAPALSSWTTVPKSDSTRERPARTGTAARPILAYHTMLTHSTVPQSALRADCAREVYSVAEALRRSGRIRYLRDVTIVLPIDYAAVEAIELACLALAAGELSEASSDLERHLDGLAGDPAAVGRLLQAVRNVVRRLGPSGPGR